MIQRLAFKHTQTVACFLLVIIYASIVLPVYAAAKTMDVINTKVYYDKEVATKHGAATALAAEAPMVVAENSVAQAETATAKKKEVEDIDGPSQPEMTSFKSISADNMVNLFTGDFSYNIPLLDVGGYPVNIYYSGGIGMEQDASWVGLGWNINPGNVNRNTRGVPDDFNGEDTLIQEQNMKPNITWGASIGPDFEAVGLKKFPQLGASAGFSLGMSFNNYLGPALELGVKGGVNFKVATIAASEKNPGDGTVLKLGLSGSANISSRYGTTLSPSVSLTSNTFRQHNTSMFGLTAATSYNSRSGIKDIQISEQMRFSRTTDKEYNTKETDECGNAIKGIRHYSSTNNFTLHSNSISFARPSYSPAIRTPVTNEAWAGHFQLGPGILGAYTSVELEVYRQKAAISNENTRQFKPMVGYLYYQNAVNNANAVMDFTRFNDKEVTSNTPVISAPQYSYDVFSIQGEGTGGSVRAYRNDLGYVRDNITTSKDKSLSIGADVGIPGHYGANVNTIKTPSTIGEWNAGNKLRQATQFTKAAGTFENVYFRNPGEKCVLNAGQYTNIGGTDLVRFTLGGSNVSPTVEPQLQHYAKDGSLLPATSIGALDVTRKKRSQVINFLTADEATRIGLDTAINYFQPGIAGGILSGSILRRVGGDRKKHHLSEIDVLEPDGKRYVYGVPVYNHMQKDFTFSVAGTDPSNTGMVAIGSATDMTTGSALLNSSTRDGYVQTTQTPAYAHSFLLSGLLSPDYVDLTGNGISDDDLGTAVKFNYTCLMSGGKPVYHNWRTPLTTGNMANFNKGLNSEDKDDKGIVSYGERESWYMHSIESKTMIAVFTTRNRNDGKGALNSFGGLNTADTTQKLLDRIDLYNKADLARNGNNAKPVKSVFFSYSFTLCAGTPNNAAAGSGKATLDSIYFTYNGQTRASKNRYIFSYINGATGNPAYEFNGADRWGTYKPKSLNPQGLTNAEYPYALQDKAQKTTIDNNAGAWSLKKILLPSGGQIEVDYESDDYAFVQNKRAMNMMSVVGFGKDATAYSSRLYDVNGDGAVTENNFLFIKVPEACTGKTEVLNKYLDGVKQLSLKLMVKMPKKEEMVPAYATIADYGVSATDATIIWVQLNMVDGISPLSLSATEFLREQLPGQAFPGYDVSESSGLAQVGDMLMGMLSGLKNAFTNPLNAIRSDNKAKYVTLEKSFVRLNDPDGFKYGGGLRVKAVRLRDNWQAMTNQYTSVYGQVYDYTTTEVFNGKTRTISSGVASYEPGLGGEENPFQNIMQVSDKLPLGPASYGAIEMPVLDAFFPSATVGYSKVTVKSINNVAASDTTKKTRSGVGKQVTEFYTAKDYPVYYSYTALEPAADKQSHQSSLLEFFYKYAYDYRALSQGFLVATNDMHGQLKSQSSYAANDSNSRISYTANFYKNTGEKGLDEKFDFVYGAQGGVVSQGNMGIDIELMTDLREFTVQSKSLEIQAQVDLFPVLFPIWLPFIWPVAGNSEKTYRAVTTTKVISYHSVLDSTVVIDKGSQVSTKNQVYDAETGNMLVSRTNNEFDLPVYNASYPAYWAYGGMGPAYKNVDAVYAQVNFYDGKIVSSGFDQSILESGDELFIITQGAGSTGCIAASDNVNKLWVFDENKNASSLNLSTRSLRIIDEQGKLFTKSGVAFRIIRSGRRNILNANVENVVLMSNPVKIVNSVNRLAIASDSKVLSAGVMEYREKWQVDNDIIRKIKYGTVTSSPDGFCTVTVNTETADCSGELERNINPYRKGLLGNFFSHRNLVYYGSRAESSVLQPTDISRNGFLDGFKLYWDFNSINNLVPDVSNAKWVWNSQVTRLNSKGMELENRNALNIYTAAQYGFNKSMPVAIANNSRYREMCNESFEDGDYAETINGGASGLKCLQKHIDFSTMTNSSIVDISTDNSNYAAHTGKKVLKVSALQTATKQFDVKNGIVDTVNMILASASINRAPYVAGIIYPEYQLYSGANLLSTAHELGSNLFSVTASSPFNLQSYFTGTQLRVTMHFYYFPPQSGNFNFYSSIVENGGGYNISVTRWQRNSNYDYTTSSAYSYNELAGYACTDIASSYMSRQNTIPVCVNDLYEFYVSYDINNNAFDYNCGTPYLVDFSLLTQGISGTGWSTNVYSSVVRQNDICNYTKPLAGTSDMLNPIFSVPAAKKMIFSAWVKQVAESDGKVQILFNSGTSANVDLQAKGPVVDGWQRVEGEFTAPLASTVMTLRFVNSNSSNAIYFDDIRIHPYNANMKSYVYDPVNLRLVAELDANNYASFYEYDAEGTLIRTKAETREGIKTITETRSAKQKKLNVIQ